MEPEAKEQNEFVERRMYRISVVEIGYRKLERIIFADNDTEAKLVCAELFPPTDTKPFRVDWKAEFIGMGVDAANVGNSVPVTFKDPEAIGMVLRNLFNQKGVWHGKAPAKTVSAMVAARAVDVHAAKAAD
jgi:hypothetical protein